jgi:hypothetical protein
MNNLTIQKNLFDLSEEGLSTSKMMYDGKTIKCLVAPYHSYKQLEEIIEHTPTTYLFPEKEMNFMQVKSFINMIVHSPKITENDEVLIITTSQNIIIDMVDVCVRILTERGEIVKSPCKTFLANIHDIRYHILENEAHQLSKSERQEGNKLVNGIITVVNDHRDNGKSMKKSDYDKLVSQIKMIGEPIIGNKLLEMARGIKVVSDKSKEELLRDMQRAVEKEDFLLAAEIKKAIDSL